MFVPYSNRHSMPEARTVNMAEEATVGLLRERESFFESADTLLRRQLIPEDLQGVRGRIVRHISNEMYPQFILYRKNPYVTVNNPSVTSVCILIQVQSWVTEICESVLGYFEVWTKKM